MNPPATRALPKGLRLHSRFTTAVLALPPDIAALTWKAIERLGDSPERIREWKGCKQIKGIRGSTPVFEARLDSGYRLSFIYQKDGTPYLLLVGHHDHLIDRTRRLLQSGHLPESGPPPDVSLEVESDRDAALRQRQVSPTTKHPLLGVSDELLRSWDVQPDQIPLVRRVEDANAIIEIKGLSSRARDSLIAYFTEGTILGPDGFTEVSTTEVLVLAREEERREKAGSDGEVVSVLGLTREFLVEIGVPHAAVPALLAAKTEEELGDIPLPLKIAQRLFEAMAVQAVTGVAPGVEPDRKVADVEELARFYNGDLTALLLQLTEDQQPVLELRLDQLHLLKGVAGSGKTTVALYRARRVVREQPRARVLIVTFTKVLANAAAELVASITEPEERSRIEVTHLHGWMARYLGPMGARPIQEKAREELLQDILDLELARSGRQSRILQRPVDWFATEISESIKGRGIGSLEEYLVLERSGRETALPEAARRAVWRVYEQYQQALGSQVDWDDLPLRALRKWERDASAAPYDFVVVDEAQDLSVAALRLAIALARQDSPAGMVVADAAQSIYRRGFRWKDTGLAVTGRLVQRLSNNHRNTAQILSAANALLASRPDLRDDGDGALTDENTPRVGPMPRLILAKDFRGQVQAIIEDIHRLRKQKGLRWGNIAILATTRYRRGTLAGELRRAGIPFVEQESQQFSLASNAVKLVTLHSAKGLEFPVVYIPDLTAGSLPRHSSDEEEAQDTEDQARRLLYVGMTRAMHELVLAGESGAPSPFLADLGSTVVRSA